MCYACTIWAVCPCLYGLLHNFSLECDWLFPDVVGQLSPYSREREPLLLHPVLRGIVVLLHGLLPSLAV